MWLKLLRWRWFGWRPVSRVRRKPKPIGTRLALECLEDRLAPATFIYVDSTLDNTNFNPKTVTVAEVTAPHATVTLVVLTRPFFMLDQEVTEQWYRRFVASDDHPAGEDLRDAARENFGRNTLACPDWRHSVLFCNWLSRREGRTSCYRFSDTDKITCDFDGNGCRLPTDAEWEHAFRCGSRTRYVTGNDIARLLDYGRCGLPPAGSVNAPGQMFSVQPGPGKQFLPNPWGLFDLLGNGWAMVWDLPAKNRGTLAINPGAGSVGTRHAIRGGSADAGLFYLHASAHVPDGLGSHQSFRVVCGPLHSAPPNDRAATLAALKNAAGDRVDVAAARARLYVEEGRWREALADLERVLAQTPDDQLLRLQMAPLFIETYSAAIALQPANVKLRAFCFMRRAYSHAALNEPGLAIADYEKALQLDPKRPTACHELAWLYATGPEPLRDLSKALTRARAAAEMAPNQRVCWNTLGMVLQRMDRHAEAVTALHRSLQLGRGELVAVDLYLLAIAHHRLGDDQQARACYDRATRWADELGPTLPPAQQAQLRTFRAEADAPLGNAGK